MITNTLSIFCMDFRQFAKFMTILLAFYPHNEKIIGEEINRSDYSQDFDDDVDYCLLATNYDIDFSQGRMMFSANGTCFGFDVLNENVELFDLDKKIKPHIIIHPMI